MKCKRLMVQPGITVGCYSFLIYIHPPADRLETLMYRLPWKEHITTRLLSCKAFTGA